MTPSLRARRARMLLLVGLLMAGVGSGLGPSAQAQEFGRLQELETNVAYFFHARPGEATIQVSVWGTVPAPGIYEVPDSTDLDKLLTMAGGAPLQPRPERQDRPEITVRVFRPQQSERTLLFEARIEEILSGSKGFNQFQDNDVLVVESVEQESFTWRDLLSFSSTAISLALLVVRIVRIRQ